MWMVIRWRGSQPTYEGLKHVSRPFPYNKGSSSQPTYEGLKRDDGEVDAVVYAVPSLPMRD